MSAYTQKLIDSIQRKKSPILLGLDPRVELLPEDAFKGSGRSSAEVAEAFYQFGARLMECLSEHIAAVKPQIAFYEALGIEGLIAYQKTLAEAKRLNIPTIADIKRGDIGSTSEAYAQAHLGGPEIGPFEADAVTLNPWMGQDSLEPFFKRCRERGKGVYLLLHTSNPGSKDLQEQELKEGKRVYEKLMEKISHWQESVPEVSGVSPIGVVAGATFPEQLHQMAGGLPNTPFLIPGYGAQGGKGKDVAPLFKNIATPHLVNASRSLTYAYREKDLSLEEGAVGAAIKMKLDILGS